jgi:hypothetical protein
VIENMGAIAGDDREVLVPLTLDGHPVYVAARQLGPRARHSGEGEIAGRSPSLDQVVGGLTAFAQDIAARLRDTHASKVTVEFGCEFAVESGTFVAVIGKASAKSAFKVGLEWSAPTH